jgi:hypothetical protein
VPNSVQYLSDINRSSLTRLLARFQLELIIVTGAKIPGSFWGGAEAGLIDNRVYARPDTPLHSILHESCHYICMDADRRASLHTNAEGDYDEENAVCYLQILLADELPEMGRQRMLADMDNWGYSFRLGSAGNWFQQDAHDAHAWLTSHQLLENNLPSFKLRQ